MSGTATLFSEEFYAQVRRHLEADGLPTIIMGCAKDIVEYCGVPRFLFSDFPLGNSAGKPHEPDTQRFTLDLALKVLESAIGPRTTVQSPLRWNDDGDWKNDYNNLARKPAEEVAKRRAEFDKVKQTALEALQEGFAVTVDSTAVRGVEVEPSLYASDFARLGDQIAALAGAGARVLHFDVGDGHFIPEITVGPIVLASISPLARGWGVALDCHLMVGEPEKHFEAIAKAGGESVTFHVEASEEPPRAIAAARALGLGVGIAFNPETSVEDAAAAPGSSTRTTHPLAGGTALSIRSTPP